jgi:flagellar biosynthesis chaperone FliJ
VSWLHRGCEVAQKGLIQQISTLQGIIQAQQETLNRLQNAVDTANERYNELVKEQLNQRWPTILDQSMFEDRGNDEKSDWLTPKLEISE